MAHRLRLSIACSTLSVALLLAGCAPSGSAPRSPSDATPAAGPSTATSASPAAASASIDAELRRAIDGQERSEQERARNRYRHPLETLAWFGLRDDMTVIELSPGNGWYTSILAPVLRDHGKLVVAFGDPNGDPSSEGTKQARELLERFKRSPATYDKVASEVLEPSSALVLGAPESADMVLTFRNFHNWASRNTIDDVLAASFKVLKHGGVLGLTDHRANAGAPTDPQTLRATGYVPEDYVIRVVERAGFKLAGRSELNANPKDTKDYPKGVWTLPPTYRLGDVDHAKYEAIGESDRMTLKFVKP